MIITLIQEYMESLLNIKENQIKELLSLYKQELSFDGSGFRKLIEEIYPQLAILLKLKKGWSSSDLYYAVLENSAKKLRIQKYKVYSEQEFCRLLNDKINDQYPETEKTDVIIGLTRSIIQNILS